MKEGESSNGFAALLNSFLPDKDKSSSQRKASNPAITPEPVVSEPQAGHPYSVQKVTATILARITHPDWKPDLHFSRLPSPGLSPVDAAGAASRTSKGENLDIFNCLFPYLDVQASYGLIGNHDHGMDGVLKRLFRLDFRNENQLHDLVKKIGGKELPENKTVDAALMRRVCIAVNNELEAFLAEEFDEKKQEDSSSLTNLILRSLWTNPSLEHRLTLEKVGAYRRVYEKLGWRQGFTANTIGSFITICFPSTNSPHYEGLPQTLMNPEKHAHDLRLTNDPYPNSGLFCSCDGCGKLAPHWVYHCGECSYDLHVACASPSEAENQLENQLSKVMMLALSSFGLEAQEVDEDGPSFELAFEEFVRILRVLLVHHADFGISQEDVHSFGYRFSAFAMGDEYDYDDNSNDRWKFLAVCFYIPVFAVWEAIEDGPPGLEEFLICFMIGSVQTLIYMSFILFWVAKFSLKWSVISTATEAHLPLILLFMLPFFYPDDIMRSSSNENEKKFDVARSRLEEETLVTLRGSEWKTFKKSGSSVYDDHISCSENKVEFWVRVLSPVISVLLVLVPLVTRASQGTGAIGVTWIDKFISVAFIINGAIMLCFYFYGVLGLTTIHLYKFVRELIHFEKLTDQARARKKKSKKDEGRPKERRESQTRAQFLEKSKTEKSDIPIMVFSTMEDLKGWNTLRNYIVTSCTRDMTSIESHIACNIFAVCIVLLLLYAVSSRQITTTFAAIVLLRVLAVVLIVSLCCILLLCAEANRRLDEHVLFLKKLLYLMNEVQYSDDDSMKRVFDGYEVVLNGMISVVDCEADFKLFGLKITIALLQSLASVAIPTAWTLIQAGYF